MGAKRKLKKSLSILTNKELRDVKIRSEVTPKKERYK